MIAEPPTARPALLAASVPRAPSARRRAADLGAGQALFGALAHTVALLRWLLLGLVALYLCSGITRVAPHEDALIYRLGRLQREVHPPGLLFALPAPIDRVVKIPTRTQHEMFLISWSPDENSATLDAAKSAAAVAAPAAAARPPTFNPALLAVLPGMINPATATALAPTGRGLHPVFDGCTLTGDTNLVQARFAARYRIANPLAYVTAAPPAETEKLIDAALYAAATHTLAAIKIDDALGAGLETLRLHVRALAQQRLDALHLGVELLAFEVHALTPPQAAFAAFADVTSAQVESRTTLEQARTYRAQVLPSAQGEAYRRRQQADADAQQLTTRATGEAGTFVALLAEHRAQPELVETRLRAETLEYVLPRVKTKTFLPAAAGSLNLFLRDNK